MNQQTTVSSPSSLRIASSRADPNRSAARAAGLQYVSDASRGITRRRGGGDFVYFAPSRRRISDAATLRRIKSLAIPPAWTEVWICPSPRGHIQAVGRDARGRKQYRYHPRWREARDDAKYHKLIDFAQALPRIRSAVRRHLKKPGLPRDKVLAAVVQVMEKTLIRVGNDEYANQNDSYGLTTLRDKHARVNGKRVRFEFRGKSGVEHEVDVDDPKLARIIRRCRDLPGEELFQYIDEDGQVCDVSSSDVNEYLRRISGGDFTAKDFRTWAGTVVAARALAEFESFDSKAQAKRNVVQAIERVAATLGNTRAVCRKCYIHPRVIETYLDGSLARHLSRKAGRMLAGSVGRLNPEEAAVLALLQQRLGRDARMPRAA